MLKKLGFKTYKEYLESELWKNLKKQIYAKKDKCDCCGSRDNLQIHHASYTFMRTKKDGKRVGSIKGLKLLCKNCHKKVHENAKIFNVGLVEATSILLRGTAGSRE